MGQIKQMQLAFDAAQDRLLFRVNTEAREEFRFWLTRRLVKLMWPVLVKALEGHVQVSAQQDPGARQTVLAFQRQQAVAQADLKTAYRNDALSLPLGEAPVLVARFQVRPGPAGNHIMGLHPEQGQGLELALDGPLLHTFCALLGETTGTTDWDIKLALGAAAQTPRPSQIN